MSTFDGIVHEFPHIRIDYFRSNPGVPAPLACFLSHVHSDHLQGLESLKSPFVYCSAATKRILLRMEKYPHRMNFAKGILEARKQHYRHLKLILKALPLETPTEIELGPKTRIQVTLFDANHCSGAVMFLIEGDGSAVLYTGDIRAENWWVNSLSRHPVLVPYTAGEQRLDCVYLDTTFASHDEIYKDFPTKAEGLVELIRKVKSCPQDTKFYFRAWTLGYEHVWIALSRALSSKIHVDDYQLRLFGSLVDESREGINIADGSALVGFQAGNHNRPGCLSSDENAHIHSCEPGTVCHTALAKRKDVVWIIPIVSRTADGTEIREMEAGGGGGDLYQLPQLETTDAMAIQALAGLCAELIKEPNILKKTIDALSSTRAGEKARISLEGLGLEIDEEIALEDFVSLVSRRVGDLQYSTIIAPDESRSNNTIHFPYSRHSSYNELRHFLSTFQPKDICPCTVDEESWSEEVSMKFLFGDICSKQNWHYDEENRKSAESRRAETMILGKRKREGDDDGETQRSSPRDDVFEMVEDDADSFNAIKKNTNLGTRQEAHSANEVSLQQELPKPPVVPKLPPAHFLGHCHESDDCNRQKQRIETIMTAFQALNEGGDTIEDRHAREGEDEDIECVAVDEEPDSQASLATSAFDSQTCGPELSEDNGTDTAVRQLNGSPDELCARRKRAAKEGRDDKEFSTRLQARIEAYRAARRCLRYNDSSEWEDLGSRIIGRMDHCEAEVEL